MKKIFLVLLAAVLVVGSLASCGAKQSVVGKWEYELTADKLTDSMSGSEDAPEQAKKIFSAMEGTMKIYMNFTEDGKYEAGVDADSMTKLINDNMENLIDVSLEMSAESAGVSVKDLLAAVKAQGMSEETLRDQLRTTLESSLKSSLEDSMADAKASGEYKFENGELDFGGSKLKVELAGDTLTIVEAEADDESKSMELFKESLLPMVFKRVG